MRGFDVVTEEDEGDEEVVNVGLMDREEDQGYILLLRKKTHTKKFKDAHIFNKKR